METFTHDGRTIAYRDTGAGPAIVMLHNGGTSSTIWRHQVDRFAPTNRVVAVDLPGFGDSPRPDVVADLDDLVGLIAALIDHLGVAPALLVGNCMGTNISVKLSRSRPDLVRGVLAVNPLTEASFSGGGLGLLYRMEHWAAAPTRGVRAISRRMNVPRLAGSPTLRFQLGRKGIAKGLHHDPELLACQYRPEQLPALVDVLDDMGAYGEIDRVPVSDPPRTWIAWGAQNRVLSRKKGAHLRQTLGAERVEVIEGCGHLPMLEDPAAVSQLIEDMLATPATETAAEASA